MNGIYGFCCGLLFLIHCGCPSVFAQNLMRINADTQMGLADAFFESQDYGNAITEYKKFIYFFPDDERVRRAAYQIGMSYFHNHSYPQALNRFVEILDQEGLSENGIASAFMISRCYQRLGDVDAAIEHLLYFQHMNTDSRVQDKIYYHLGWLYLESGNVDLARTAFSGIRAANQQQYDISIIMDALDKYTNVDKKNPVTAGILSVIPGAGYLYCGRYRDAVMAFLVNGVCIYGACESFDQHLYAVGGIMAFLGMGFYAGNIYGSITSAYKFKQSEQHRFIRHLKKSTPPKLDPDLLISGGSQNIFLGLKYRF